MRSAKIITGSLEPCREGLSLASIVITYAERVSKP